jgi:hypothetical protein
MNRTDGTDVTKTTLVVVSEQRLKNREWRLEEKSCQRSAFSKKKNKTKRDFLIRVIPAKEGIEMMHRCHK